MRGDQTLVELAEHFNVHPNQIAQWRAELLERAAEVFATAADKRDAGAGHQEPAREDRPAGAGERFFGRRARSHRRCERKAMIDPSHPLPIVRQAQLLDLSRSSVYYQPRPTSERRSGADAPHRRAAPGASVRRQPDAARSAAPRRLRSRSQARGDADAQDGHRSALPEAEHERTRSPSIRSIRICCAG